MPRKVSRGRRPQSRRGGGLITWLAIILLIAVIALLAMPYLQRTTPTSSTGAAESDSGERRPHRDTGESEPDTQPPIVPESGPVVVETAKPRPPRPSAPEDQEANEVAAEISQGVVTYDRAVRNQQEPAPKPAEPSQH